MGWTLGAVLLALTMFSNRFWAEWFLHPLNTEAGTPGEDLLSGVTLLRIMLPIAGLCWLTWTLRLQTRPGHSPTRQYDTSWLFIIPAAAILILGTIIRLPLLEDSLWYDEIAGFWYYGQFGPGPIIGNMFTPANHTLQTLGSWASVIMSGGSLEPEIIRLPALILGLATIWPMSALARDAFQARPFMLLSITLLLLCPIAILESTEARGYAFMLFFGTSSSALLVRYLSNGNTALLPFYAVVTALGIWSHLVTVVVPMGHAVFLLGTICLDRTDANARRRSWLGVCAIGLAAVTTITLLAPTLPGLLSDSEAFSASRADQPVLFGREGVNSLLGLGGAWSFWGGLSGLTLLGFGLLASFREKGLRRPFLVTGMPILIAVTLVSGLGTWVYARFLVFGISFSVLALAAGIHLLWSRSRVLGTVATGVLLLGWGNDLLGRYQVPRQPIRDIMTAIPKDGSGIGFIGITDLGIVLSWYADDPDRVIDLTQDGTIEPAQKRADIDWIVIAYPSRTIPETRLEDLSFDLASSQPGSLQKVVEGFIVRRLEPGWIDNDGTVLLLERAKNGM